jgi:hypothetical protein
MAKKTINLYEIGMAILMESTSGFDEPPEQKKERVKMSGFLKMLTPKSQFFAMLEEWEAHAGAIERMNEIVDKMPRLHETDSKEFKGRHPLALHYFLGGCDWYISEWDRGDNLFGYVILNNDVETSAWGYISLSELLHIESEFYKKSDVYRTAVMQLDYQYPYKTVEEALFIHYPKYFSKYDPAHLQKEKEKDTKMKQFTFFWTDSTTGKGQKVYVDSLEERDRLLGHYFEASMGPIEDVKYNREAIKWPGVFYGPQKRRIKC